MSKPNQDQTELKKRKALIISVIFLVAILINFGLSIFREHPTGAWQHTVRLAVVFLFGIITLLSIYKIRQGEVEKSISLLIHGFLFTLLSTVLLLSGLGIVIAAISLIITSSVSFSSLPKERRLRPLIASIVIAILAYTLDLLPLNYRIQAPATLRGIFATIAGVIVIAILVLLIRTSRDAIRHYLEASVHNRLKAIVISTAIIPILLVSTILGITTYTQIRSALKEEAFNKLTSVQKIKHAQITNYLQERKADTITLSNAVDTLYAETANQLDTINSIKHDELVHLYQGYQTDIKNTATDPNIVEKIDQLITAFRAEGAANIRALYLGEGTVTENDSNYSLVHSSLHPSLLRLENLHGYKNIFILDTNGNIVYSTHKNNGFGSSLVFGDYRTSSLAALYQKLLSAVEGETRFEDLNLFEGEYALFIGTPIYSQGKLIGTIIYQLDVEDINDIIASEIGQGTTEHSFVIAQEYNKSVTLRSNWILTEDETLRTGANITDRISESIRKPLLGEEGIGFVIDKTERPMIVAYRPIEIEGLTWGIVSEVEGKEIFAPQQSKEEKDFLTRYKEEYNYADILLVHPNGEIFYTVNKSSEYHSNIFTEEYKDSSFASLINALKTERNFQFVDYAYYFPASKPVAFMGMPVLDQDDQVIMYVAIQLPLDKITAILTELTGLGETGETYLVGSDKLWRNNSRFFSELGTNSTVLNVAFKVDTVASRSALSGEEGKGIIQDYRGRQVLSVWSPIVITEPDAIHPQGQVWALIAEINEKEALTPVNNLTGTLGIVIGLSILVIGALAIYFGTRFATDFVSPILNLTDNATKIAESDFDVEFTDINRQDEFGILSKTFSDMTLQLKDMLKGLEKRVLERTRALEISTEVSRRLSTILDKNELVKEVVDQLVKSFGYYYAHIYLFDKKKEKLIMMGGTGEAGKIMLSRGHTLEVGQGLVGRAAKHNAVVLVKDTQNEAGWLPNDLLPETRSEIAVPIAVGEEVLGVFDVQHNVLNGLTEEDANVMQSIANQVAIALQNAEAYEKTQQQVAREELMSNINKEIQNATTVEEALKVAVRELGRALNTETSIQLDTTDTENQ